MALLDVVVALVVLALGGVAFTTLLRQTIQSMRRVHDVEAETQRASDELDRLVIVGRTELAAMAGRSVVRGWWIDVVPAGQDLFDVTISATDTTPPVLRTTLYRPDSTDATP
jgi:hypothetical protein